MKVNRWQLIAVFVWVGFVLSMSIACGDDPVMLRSGDTPASGMVENETWEFEDGVTDVWEEIDQLWVILDEDVIGSCGAQDQASSARRVTFPIEREVGESEVHVTFESYEGWDWYSSTVSGQVEITEISDGIIYGSVEASDQSENEVSGDFAALDCH